jgi:hypothetical protein
MALVVLLGFSNVLATLSERLELPLSDTRYRPGRRDHIGQEDDSEVSLLAETPVAP